MPLRRLGSMLLLSALPLAAQTPNPNRPTLFAVGDLPSTPIHQTFDPNLLKVVESPANGQTTRTYINSGAWDKLTAQIKPGDFVLIEFNPDQPTDKTEQGTDTRDAATRTFHGAGDGTFDYLDPGTHKLELVHTYGWYLRKLVVDTINHGANPILCSPPSQTRANSYADWAKAIATEQRIPYLDLSDRDLTTQPIRPALESLKPDPLAPYLTQEK